MARRGLPPRRARHLFADHGREPTEEERKPLKSTPRPVEEIVWTAAREDQAEIVLDSKPPGASSSEGRSITFSRSSAFEL
jgi:hypothetical protein